MNMEIAFWMSSLGILINDNVNRIFIQDNPSVPSTVINGVLLTKKQKCIKRKLALG